MTLTGAGSFTFQSMVAWEWDTVPSQVIWLDRSLRQFMTRIC